ncbi:MAG: aconitate hydratase AcnA [Desulfatirhabdiaceae bacterium]
MPEYLNSFHTQKSFSTDSGDLQYFSLTALEDAIPFQLEQMPYSLRILLENLLRNEDGFITTAQDIKRLTQRDGIQGPSELPLFPARVLLQDFTGVPAVVDLAAMRDAAQRLYGTPIKINPVIPAELVIDHSVQVDYYGTDDAFDRNSARDYERNQERYAFLRWGQKSLGNFRVVPPATGICHQVNLEYLGRVVCVRDRNSEKLVFPDTLVGLDSHTTMINGLGVLGWGVGGIEAEAVMLGSPYYLLTPDVVGFRLIGRLGAGITATDLVLTITEILRKKGVVGKFVEFFGSGLTHLSVEDRATIANMAPEYGATMGFFPVDEKTIDYLRLTGRTGESIKLVETYCKTQKLFREASAPDPIYHDVVELDMTRVIPCLAGPKRPQDRVPLSHLKSIFHQSITQSCEVVFQETNSHTSKPVWEQEGGSPVDPDDPACGVARRTSVTIDLQGQAVTLNHGAVVIAAITSCTNTSNPAALISAGLLAKKAVETGLKTPCWVKTSFAPGSKVATRYLRASGLLAYLEALNFHLAAYGCTTCIGNSGPLPESITQAVKSHDLVVTSILSGNRNFEGRINPVTRANFLTSPALVVAFALAGTIDIDLDTEPIGIGTNGIRVYLRDIWPSDAEVREIVTRFVRPELYQKEYAEVFDGADVWRNLPVPDGALYHWNPRSTYIQEPPFFQHLDSNVSEPMDIANARILAILGDSVTTDHISPAGTIPAHTPAGQYLIAQGVTTENFNSYGARRGNHQVMIRGTFANIRLNNELVPGTDGGYTRLLPEKETMTIYDAAMTYQKRGTPLVVIAGREYGTGSSRDWAAKGTLLLGIKAVIAESFERIHRSNLVCMGVLPLQFMEGENRKTLGLDGTEKISIIGITEGLAAGKILKVSAIRTDDAIKSFWVTARLDSRIEVTYYRHGGILNYVLRNMS